VAFVDAVARREGETKSGREGNQFAGQKLVVTHLARWLLTHKFRKQGGGVDIILTALNNPAQG
jgi:hypothetical protein